MPPKATQAELHAAFQAKFGVKQEAVASPDSKSAPVPDERGAAPAADGAEEPEAQMPSPQAKPEAKAPLASASVEAAQPPPRKGFVLAPDAKQVRGKDIPLPAHVTRHVYGKAGKAAYLRDWATFTHSFDLDVDESQVTTSNASEELRDLCLNDMRVTRYQTAVMLLA